MTRKTTILMPDGSWRDVDLFDADMGADIYSDGGCDVAKSCLRCPLAFCKYDMTGTVYASSGAKAAERIERDRAILDMRKHGARVGDIAAALEMPGSLVSRIIARGALAEKDLDLARSPELVFGSRAAFSARKPAFGD